MTRAVKDSQGRTWEIRLDVSAFKRIEKLTGIRIQNVTDGEMWERLASDPVAVVDVLYAAVKPQCDSLRLTDEAFGQAMTAGIIEQATDALIEELNDFFRDSPKAKVVETAKTLIRARNEALTNSGS